MKPNRNENEITQFTMRINTELYEIIKQRAVINKRSTAKEIEFSLEKIYKQN